MSKGNAPVGSDQPSDLRHGLPMVAKWNPEALAREKALLAELDAKPLGQRLRGYLGKSGPGWLQSALTLGAGSATSSLFAGALLGYSLLWVILATLFTKNLTRSRVGRAFVAIRDRYLSAEVMGVNVWGYRILSFGDRKSVV